MVARGTEEMERIALRVQMTARVDSINQARKYKSGDKGPPEHENWCVK